MLQCFAENYNRRIVGFRMFARLANYLCSLEPWLIHEMPSFRMISPSPSTWIHQRALQALDNQRLREKPFTTCSIDNPARLVPLQELLRYPSCEN
jgi:hypothetical protein